MLLILRLNFNRFNGRKPRMNMRNLILTLLLIVSVSSVQADHYVYKVVLVRAAPDKLMELIELLKEDISNHEVFGLEKPFMMRHSQGDQWDLFLIWPIESMGSYFSANSLEKRQDAVFLDKPYDNIIYDYIAYHEELFVEGPTLEEFRSMFETYDYYHVEMFVALANKRRELLKEREMENDYLVAIGRRPNLIFNKVAGSKWDNFSIGFYKDIKDYAASADIDPMLKEKAARDAGFEGADFIGSYLRRFINEHNDTLAGAIKN